MPQPLGESSANWSKVRILPPALRMRLRARLLTRRAHTWGHRGQVWPEPPGGRPRGCWDFLSTAQAQQESQLLPRPDHQHHQLLEAAS